MRALQPETLPMERQKAPQGQLSPLPLEPQQPASAPSSTKFRRGKYGVMGSSTPSSSSTTCSPSSSEGVPEVLKLPDMAEVESEIIGKELQVSWMHKSSNGTTRRQAFKMTRVSIIDDCENPFYKRLLLVNCEGLNETVRLLDTTASFVTLSQSHPEDAQPYFGKHSVTIGFPDSERSLIIASPTVEDQRSFLDCLCTAGCIVPDLVEHFELLPQAEQTVRGVHVGRAISSRTTTNAEVVALKIACTEDKMLELIEEVQILLNLQHDGIVAAYGIYAVKIRGKRSLGMILDYKSGGDLGLWIPTNGFPEWMVQGIVAPICDALGYLHGIPAIHRDIKPGNVLCERAVDGSVKVILADFGIAAYIEDSKRLSQRCGTAGFIAPEILHNNWATKWRTETASNLTKTDMFSFGVLIYTAVFGQTPFVDTSSLSATYRRNAHGLLPLANMEGRSVELQSLLSGLCAKDPRQRVSSKEALAHPWLDSDRGGSCAGSERKYSSVEWTAFEEAAHGFSTDFCSSRWSQMD
jgi:hypothetical protein